MIKPTHRLFSYMVVALRKRRKKQKDLKLAPPLTTMLAFVMYVTVLYL